MLVIMFIFMIFFFVSELCEAKSPPRESTATEQDSSEAAEDAAPSCSPRYDNADAPVAPCVSETATSEVGAVLGSARDEAVSAPSAHDDVDRMEEAGGTARFSDDRSDSGVSSLRSCSGDERSGSRSSALSSSDEPPPQPPQTTRSPLCGEPVRVWRDPSLAAEPRVRHVHSVQHQSLLMSHPQVRQPPAITLLTVECYA